MHIHGKVVTLRAIERTDMAMLCGMLNDSEIERSVAGWSFPLSLEQQTDWFVSHLHDEKNQRFVIDVPNVGAVGLITLTNIDWKNRSAVEGLKLCREEYRGKGFGTDALMALLRYAFDELGLHRLTIRRLKENKASERLHEKCGAKVEGYMRECIFKQGQYHDLVLYGIIESDYRNLILQNNYWETC